MQLKDAVSIWNRLNGLICVYKPANVACHQVRSTIIYHLYKGLNELECRPPRPYVNIDEYGTDKFQVEVKPNLADHVLVTGPRYQQEDIKCSWANFLGKNTSGVLLLGINRGTKLAKFLRENRPTRCYRIVGCLGEATENGFAGEQVVERAKWRHVTPIHVERILTNIQASQQKEMFNLAGVDPQTQAAHDLAVQGPFRPANSKNPVIYGIKCVDFRPPHFTLEIQCVNEYEMFLKVLVHEIGRKLRSTAHTTSIQCIRHSHFSIDNALLRKHWTLKNFMNNMDECNAILDEHENLLLQTSAQLQ